MDDACYCLLPHVLQKQFLHGKAKLIRAPPSGAAVVSFAFAGASNSLTSLSTRSLRHYTPVHLIGCPTADGLFDRRDGSRHSFLPCPPLATNCWVPQVEEVKLDMITRQAAERGLKSILFVEQDMLWTGDPWRLHDDATQRGCDVVLLLRIGAQLNTGLTWMRVNSRTAALWADVLARTNRMVAKRGCEGGLNQDATLQAIFGDGEGITDNHAPRRSLPRVNASWRTTTSHGAKVCFAPYERLVSDYSGGRSSKRECGAKFAGPHYTEAAIPGRTSVVHFKGAFRDHGASPYAPAETMRLVAGCLESAARNVTWRTNGAALAAAATSRRGQGSLRAQQQPFKAERRATRLNGNPAVKWVAARTKPARARKKPAARSQQPAAAAASDDPSWRSTVFNPFAPNNTAAYLVKSVLELRRRRYEWLVKSGRPLTHGELLDHRISYNALGLSLPHGWDFGSRMMTQRLIPSYLMKPRDTELVQGGDHPQTHPDDPDDQRTAIQVILEHDHMLKRRPQEAPNGGVAKILKSLDQNGFALFGPSSFFGLSSLGGGGNGNGLPMEQKIAGAYRRALDKKQAATSSNGNGNGDGAKRSKPVTIIDEQIRGAESLLRKFRPKLIALGQAYLGDDAELVPSVRAIRLAAGSLRSGALGNINYPAGAWHHDRCGRRLKVFLFLTDVNNETHPTRVAKGSHRTLYYSYHTVPESRFADEYIDSSYSIVPLTGVRFGGFVLDTNAIHKATLDGDGGHRDVLVFELNAEAKSRKLAWAPCGHAQSNEELQKRFKGRAFAFVKGTY